MTMTMMMMMRRLTDVYHHARGRELTSVSTAPEARSMCDSTVYLAATLKSLAIMSPLGTMFVHEGAERRVSWRQTVRAEVIAASVGVQVQRYPTFARFVTVVDVAHEGRRQEAVRRRRRQSVFGYDTAKYRSGARVHRQ